MAEFGNLVRPEVAVRRALRQRRLREFRPDQIEEMVSAGRRSGIVGMLFQIGATVASDGTYVLKRPSRANRDKTHCPSGHPYDEANTYRRPGGRGCRACTAARNAAAYEKRAAQRRAAR